MYTFCTSFILLSELPNVFVHSNIQMLNLLQTIYKCWFLNHGNRRNCLDWLQVAEIRHGV